MLTGMPQLMPVLPVLVVELAIYGLVCGYLYQNRGLGIWIALIAAMTAGRLAAAITTYGIVALFAFKAVDGDYLP